ncbi:MULTISPECIES: class I SAM-dependent methyltransferase [unclassified Ensifer]|uniref:class I SAM-dependent methyltransferase n=1 Tax=unclassified Ensifer TaxID=2633371 RepID=UPI000812EA0E|nr:MULTISPECIES: class I SAM-dependent methyltransferase [unclassified Ensifer]OCP07489.1 methyltransferase [Ensifer sp. LC11]OCP07596.1 methyltransferase [Ensifer sp. LC14]OCP08264.1 methyltransferase [Ensifer sp. LC13]OCP31985.1 methyltransferase [Ensifer sp. LC499]
MNRETTNRIRFLIEDVIPPILRDSRLFKGMASLAWGKHIAHLAEFRARAPFLSAGEYEDLYRKHPRVHEGTDNSEACVRKIAASVAGESVCDVGCGTGVLLKRIRAANPRVGRLTGVDFAVDDAAAIEGVEYRAAMIEDLPFADGEFDTVVCTHVIEHILDYRKAIAELRRITRRRLIIVVPREREYRYTFNPHFNFFPYTHSFLRAVHPVPAEHECIDIGRDIYYREDKASAA